MVFVTHTNIVGAILNRYRTVIAKAMLSYWLLEGCFLHNSGYLVVHFYFLGGFYDDKRIKY